MKIFVYSGTHWDREWYQPFQGFRKRLVDMLEELINFLENDPDFGVFHLDGQTIVLEDYLAIRPEMKDRLAALIKKGKIVIGPWFDMPDEFLVSGESLISNLRLGMKISREWGVEPAKNGYICDIFGHSSQTPQIFAGMGLYHTVLGRGLSDLDAPGHFRWAALDGTEIRAFHEEDVHGYGQFAGVVMWPNPPSNPIEQTEANIKKYVESELNRCKVPVLFLMDATDHAHVHPTTSFFVKQLRRIYPDAVVSHGSIDEYGEAIDEYIDQLPVVKGELARTGRVPGGYVHIITNTLSSRYPIKKYNDEDQNRIEKWAGPLYALGRTNFVPGFLNLAKHYLLQNHPHDSICGCSIDQVHKDMMYRFDQTRLLCDEITRPYLNSLGGDLSATAITPAKEQEGIRLRVFNPLPYRTKKTVTAKVNLKDLPHYCEPFGYENIPSFFLYDADGNQVPYGFVKNKGKENYEIAFSAEIAPCGVTEFSLVPSRMPSRNPYRMPLTPTSVMADKLSVSINPNGTVDLTDLETGEVYRNLLTLIDDGEIGDGWFHCNPNLDRLVSPTRADVQIIENNPVRVTFRITQIMELPESIDETHGINRSERLVEFRAVHELTVAKSERYIDVVTRINNNVCDHRLRLRLPAVCEGETYEAAQAFGYVTRKCGDDPETRNWKEYQLADRNMANLCAKRNGKRGLAFLSAAGLHECGVWPNGDMDVTLMRCFRKTVQTEGEPGGELLENLEYKYRIALYTENDRFSDLQKEQDFLATGFASFNAPSGAAQKYDSPLEVSGRDVIYSTAGLLDDGSCEVRVFNDSDEATTAKITLPAFAKSASLIELDGRPIMDLTMNGREVTFDLPAFRVATVKYNG